MYSEYLVQGNVAATNGNQLWQFQMFYFGLYFGKKMAALLYFMYSNTFVLSIPMTSCSRPFSFLSLSSAIPIKQRRMANMDWGSSVKQKPHVTRR